MSPSAAHRCKSLARSSNCFSSVAHVHNPVALLALPAPKKLNALRTERRTFGRASSAVSPQGFESRGLGVLTYSAGQVIPPGHVALPSTV